MIVKVVPYNVNKVYNLIITLLETGYPAHNLCKRELCSHLVGYHFLISNHNE